MASQEIQTATSLVDKYALSIPVTITLNGVSYTYATNLKLKINAVY